MRKCNGNDVISIIEKNNDIIFTGSLYTEDIRNKLAKLALEYLDKTGKSPPSIEQVRESKRFEYIEKLRKSRGIDAQ